MPVFHGRRVLLKIVSLITFRNLVGTQALYLVQGMSHRRDIVRWHGLQLVDEIDNCRQLLDKFSRFLLRQLKSCQRRDMLNLVFA